MSKTVEEWRDIEGYEGLYQVSDWGNVRSLNYHRQKITKLLKPYKNYKGYLKVHLGKVNDKHCSVHRLVAEAFIPNPENKEQVGHLKKLPDGTEDKTANEVWNLAWMTNEENCNFGTKNERVKIANTNNPLKSRQVYQYTLDGELVAIYPSVMEAERNGFCHAHIIHCCQGLLKTHKGYKWSYTPLQ